MASAAHRRSRTPPAIRSLSSTRSPGPRATSSLLCVGFIGVARGNCRSPCPNLPSWGELMPPASEPLGETVSDVAGLHADECALASRSICMADRRSSEPAPRPGDRHPHSCALMIRIEAVRCNSVVTRRRRRRRSPATTPLVAKPRRGRTTFRLLIRAHERPRRERRAGERITV